MIPSRLMALLFACSIAAILFSCRPSSDTASEFSVNVRLPSEPENLHPMLTKSSYGVQIAGQVMLAPAEFDPVTLELSPLLITAIPSGEEVKEGKHAGGKKYMLQFRPEATWDDGSPVTGQDYLFTVKAASNPYVNTAWKSWMPYLSEISVDTGDPKSVTVYMDSNYILSLEVLTNFFVYPAHAYDPQNIMSGFTLEDLRDPNISWTAQQDSLLNLFAASFQSLKFLRDSVQGAGPYKFHSWSTGEQLSLTRKENWWGDKVQDPPLLLQAYPQSLHYRFIIDAAAAEAALKAGEIDVMSEIPPASFLKMKEDPAWKDNFHFQTPEIMQIYAVDMNNRDPILSDVRIRKALAYSIDYEGIMENLLMGLGRRTVGPIPPQRSYYHKGLQPIEQDINKSLSLIREAGWEDSNENGIADKIINGKREELQLEITITNKEEGQILASIMRENAKKAGIDIVVEIVDPNEFNQALRSLDFDLIPVRQRPPPSMDDPYQTFHSASDRPGGGNRSGFRSSEVDDIIMRIRTAETIAERDSHYYKLQEVLYEEQPVLYLYVPVDRVIISKKFEVINSSRKPGYFENLFKLAG